MCVWGGGGRGHLKSSLLEREPVSKALKKKNNDNNRYSAYAEASKHLETEGRVEMTWDDVNYIIQDNTYIEKI